MPQEEKKGKRILRKLLNSYLVMIIDEESFEEQRQIRVSRIKVILLTSIKAKNLKNKVDLIIPVPSKRVDRIQEMHIGIGHIICETVENCIN